jgi:hypothetical protein
MKTLQIIAYSIFLIGLILKFFHFPKNAIIMMIGIFLILLIYAIAALNKKYDRLYSINGFATSFWLISLLFTLKFWPFSNLLLLISSLLTIISIVYSYKLKRLKELKLLFISSIICLTFYIMPSDIRYYLINIKWNQEIETDYYSWDKYSWFLYQNAHYDQALETSNHALKIANQYAKRYDEVEFIEIIDNHNKMIKNKTWNKYR